MTLLDKKSHFNCEINAWGFRRNMRDFSNIIVSNLKVNMEKEMEKLFLTQLAKTPQDRTMAKAHVKTWP